ncbi:MAG: nicotinate (nicotinamide) nucleotide adenylyltransferase [Planctomycetota bacterium]
MAADPADALADLCLFGGAFNPPHLTHERMVRAAAAQLPVTRLLVLPTGQHPLKDPAGLAPAEIRLELCRLAFAGIPKVEVSDLELRRAGPSYTVDTLEWFREYVTQGRRPFWLVGSDNLTILPSWHRYHDLLRLCALVAYPRVGHPIDGPALRRLGLTAAETEEIVRHALRADPDEVSSTDVRAALAAGRPITDVVAPAVAERVRALGLYGAPAP